MQPFADAMGIFSTIISQTSWPLPLQHGPGAVDRHPDDGLRRNEGRRRRHQLHRLHLHMQQRRTGLREPALDGLLELACLRDAVSPKAHRPRNLAEVGVLQVRVHRHQAGCLLLDIDKPELAVVVDDDLDRQVLLHRRQQIAEQHGEPAVAGQTNHLPAGLALLQSERRWHPARHRAVEQAGEGSALAAGVDVAKHPDRRRPVVRREQRVLGGMLVDDLGQVGPGNGGVGTRHGFGLRRCHVLLVTLHMDRQEAAVLVLLEARQQSLQGRLDIADRPDRDRMSSPDMRGIDIDLNDRRLVRIELASRRNPLRAGATHRSRGWRDSRRLRR